MSIIIESLSKSVMLESKKSLTILSEVSLTINEGEMVAIKGKSGAGKSTLLHILGLLDTPTSGNYILDGIDVSKLTKSDCANYRNTKFGFIMQDFALINDETVIENIILPAIFSKKKLRIAKQEALELLDRFGVSELANRKVGLLSGGEKQRIAIIRALINDPPYILADEPTGALDTINAENIMSIFSTLKTDFRKTIVIVTHDNMVSEKCDRIIEISDGVII